MEHGFLAWGEEGQGAKGVDEAGEHGEGDGELLTPRCNAMQSLETPEHATDAIVFERSGVEAQVDVPRP